MTKNTAWIGTNRNTNGIRADVTVVPEVRQSIELSSVDSKYFKILPLTSNAYNML